MQLLMHRAQQTRQRDILALMSQALLFLTRISTPHFVSSSITLQAAPEFAEPAEEKRTKRSTKKKAIAAEEPAISSSLATTLELEQAVRVHFSLFTYS